MNDASIALAARVVLAAALTVSALAKLRSRAEVKQQVALLVSDALAPVVAPAVTAPTTTHMAIVAPGCAPAGEPIASTAKAPSTPLRTMAAGPTGVSMRAAPKHRHGTRRA